MKKLLAILFITAFTICAVQNKTVAQVVTLGTLTKTSLSSTDTSWCTLPVTINTRSVECHALKTSGSVAGKVYLLGTVDGTNYDKLDSMTVSNVATAQWKVIPIRYLDYAVYKFQFLSAGGVWVPKVYIHRRTGL